MSDLSELLDRANNYREAQIVDTTKFSIGGVDPLGLRQINFELMDRVLPNLNNVARHIRPYVLMAGAWRRVRLIMEEHGLSGASDREVRDFVDRVEAIYAWSQFLLDAGSDIPGAQAMRQLLQVDSYQFGGKEWEKRRDVRRYSTGLISPLNYGPSLRTMGWLAPVEGHVGVFQPDSELDSVLDEFESCLGDEIKHDAFSRFGSVTVEAKDAERWGKLWKLDAPRVIEAEAMFERLGGAGASNVRQDGISLVRAAYADLGNVEPKTIKDVRMRMCDQINLWSNPSNRPPVADAWEEVQIRQLFRLALEALLYWIVGKLLGGPLSSRQLATMFLSESNIEDSQPPTFSQLASLEYEAENPVKHLNSLEKALKRDLDVPSNILRALAVCIVKADQDGHGFENSDRLPLSRAKKEALAWQHLSIHDFLIRVIEVWVMAQHAYWAVGRGLADARSRGKSILRLRVVMDGGGWTLTPGTTKQGNPPQPTPDRLETALSLLRECDRLNESGAK